MDAPVENSKVGVIHMHQAAGFEFTFSLKIPEYPGEGNLLDQLQ